MSYFFHPSRIKFNFSCRRNDHLDGSPSWKVFRFKRWATCTPDQSWRDGTKRTDDIAPRRGLDRSPTGDQVPPTLSSSNTQAWPPAGVLSTAMMPTSNSVVPSNLRPPCPPSHPVKSRPRLWAEYRIISTNHRTARDVLKELLRTQVWRSNRLRNRTHPDTFVPNPVLNEICKCVWRLPCVYFYCRIMFCVYISILMWDIVSGARVGIIIPFLEARPVNFDAKDNIDWLISLEAELQISFIRILNEFQLFEHFNLS